MMPFQIHPAFKLKGQSLNAPELLEIGKDLIKSSAPFEQEIGSFIVDWFGKSETITVHTSGSTGTPKPIRLQKQRMVNSAKATGAYFHATAGTRALHCLPTRYIAGKMMLVRAMVLGWELEYIQPDSKPLESVEATFDFCAMVPLQLANSLEYLEKVKTVIIGGAPLKAHLINAVQDSPTAVYETYGMTETITHVALKRVNEQPVDRNPIPGKPRAENLHNTTYFSALPNITFSKDDRDCLVITAPRIVAAPVVTNDMVNLVSNTAFEWLGRYDNVINSGGVKLFPEQIEAKLAPYIASRFFVAGIKDHILGQMLVLFIEGKEDGEALLHKIKNLKVLEPYEVPKKVLVVSQFDETPTGKIKRATLIKKHP